MTEKDCKHSLDEKRPPSHNDESHHSNASTTVPETTPSSNLISTLKKLTLFLGILLSMFMVSLNTTVVAPAMSIIATELNDLSSQTWIATAYLVAFNASQPLSGKFSDIFGRKSVLLFGILLFFIGSLVNALSYSMGVLIPGRTVQGFGGGCVMSLAFILITDLAPLHLRPRFQSLLTVVYGLASVVGPLIGGAFVDKVDWHWDFWLNVILSAISWIIIFFLLKEPTDSLNSSFLSKIKRIDWLGTIFAISFICCLLLGLNWGGSYGWSSAHSVGPFVGAAVSLIALVITEGWIAPEPLLPAEIMMNPRIIVLYLYITCLGVGFIGTLYFGPILFQAVFGADSTQSGIRLIPYMVLLITGSIGSSWFMILFPYVKLYIVIGAVSNLLGYGLFYTVNEYSSYSQQVGFLTFCGFAYGLSQTNVILGVQIQAGKKNMAVATSLNNFFLMLASSVGVAVYQALFQIFLGNNLKNVDSSILAIANDHGAIENYLYIRNMPEYAQRPIIHAYYQALHTVFIIPIVTGGIGVICALCIKNTRFGGPKPPKEQSKDQIEESIP
ncbi:major facilitator superfamily domain-containing protein [Radiomyces spectabilis]|uniref:major facilitator superfamily domain-containing protein n=1 Tax=Radiomyces spectabilis TaxID=64574 RepID=UPI002220F064|nr:major facilitator superfamily domain-containing protein [Radiomyces spectabilis]KAI8391422.1 major facilitator superfamily domain-containing protein [Radiomyces spectabilis]